MDGMPRSGVERSSNVHSSRIVSRCRSPLCSRSRQERLPTKQRVPTRFAHGREPPLQLDAADQCAKPSQASYLKESDTRVRNAATLPSSTFMSICVTFLPRFVADTDDLDDLVDRIRRLLLRHGILRRLDCARARGARDDGNSIRGSNLSLDAGFSRSERREWQQRAALIRGRLWKPRKEEWCPR